MKNLLFAVSLLFVPLGACELPPPVSPGEVANRTMLDEKVALSIETAYAATAEALTLGIRAGLIKGPAVAKVIELDNRAYSAVLATRRAYAAGNATDYTAAAQQALPIIRELLTVIKGSGK